MYYKRRDFLKVSSALTAAWALSPLAGCGSAGNTRGNQKIFGLQLYTLRDVLPQDPKGVLQQVAAYGYKQIEGYEGPMGLFWGMKNTEFKKFIGDLGMQMVSTHCNWKEDLERKAAECAEIDINYILCPYLGPQKDLAAFRQFAAQFNKAGEMCKKKGIRFGYHNHDYSFKKVEGEYPQDVLMQSTDKDLVDYEMDIYWVVAAGEDPIAWLNKYPGRFKLGHVKDRKGSESVVLGTGTIDFARVLKEGREKGMKYFIVEQEAYTGTTPLKAVEDNAVYMKNLTV